MKKLLLGILALVIIAVVGVGIFVATFDVDSYRAQIAEELSQKTGRKVSLSGPIKLGLSMSGATLTIQDAAIGNPQWASRPEMAGIGSFELGISVPPLLDHKLVVTSVKIANADIDLEATSATQNNWTLTPAAGATVTAPTKDVGASGSKAARAPSAAPVSIHVEKFLVTDSQVTYRANGQVTVFKVSTMSIGGVDGATFILKAEYNGTPISVNVKTGAADVMNLKGSWPFTADLGYANYNVTAEGKADLDKKVASVSTFDIKAGGSILSGALDANWSGSKPSLKGNLKSASITPADFAMTTDGKHAAAPATASPNTAGRQPLFTTAPLALGGLNSVNAAFDIDVTDIVLSNGSLKDTSAKITLLNGLLTIEPFKTTIGSGTLEGQIKVDGATNPAQISVLMNAPNILLQDLLKMAGAPSFLSGNANFQVNLASNGNSTQALASNSVGVINLIASGGTVSSGAAKDISSSLMQLFAPGGSNVLNCLAARFILKNGVAQDNGILADTTATTVLGKGGFNLGLETIDMTLRAKAKQENIGDLLPAASITGTFQDPRFSVNPADVLKNVAGLFTGGGTTSPVPTLTTEGGQNACVYTLEHPTATTATAQGVLPPTLTGKAQQSIQNVGGLLKGFMGGK